MIKPAKYYVRIKYNLIIIDIYYRVFKLKKLKRLLYKFVNVTK